MKYGKLENQNIDVREREIDVTFWLEDVICRWDRILCFRISRNWTGLVEIAVVG